jgi:DNA-binding winged helix-turn-helix (wHTH) protein
MLYRFDEYELDLQRYELHHAGQVVKLEPQVFDVLVYLIQHRERVVTKDEFVEHVWGGRLVSEAMLTSRVMAARRAVGDRGREQRMIQTLHGRGYRFIAAVEERTTDSTSLAAERPMLSQAALTPKPIRLCLQPSALLLSWGAMRSSLSCIAGCNGRATALDRSSSLPEKPAWARQPWWIRSLRRPVIEGCSGSAVDNALNTTAPGKLICLCWRPSDSSAGALAGRCSWICWRGRRPRGSCSSHGY